MTLSAYDMYCSDHFLLSTLCTLFVFDRFVVYLTSKNGTDVC